MISQLKRLFSRRKKAPVRKLLMSEIYSKKQLIGTTKFRVGDYSKGILHGSFMPNNYYLNNVQPDVWAYNDESTEQFETWEELEFQIIMENGVEIIPKGIMFIDFPRIYRHLIQFEMCGVDHEIIKKYYLL